MHFPIYGVRILLTFFSSFDMVHRGKIIKDNRIGKNSKSESTKETMTQRRWWSIVSIRPVFSNMNPFVLSWLLNYWVTLRGWTYRQGDCFIISRLNECLANSHHLEDLNTHQHFLRQLANLVDKPYQQYYSWLVESIISLLDVQLFLYMMLTLSIIFKYHLHPCSFPQIFKRNSHIMVLTKIHKSCSGWHHSKACHKYAFS
jgi:hypothetical protein